MKKYKPVDITEAQLEDLVRQGPELIEDGLRYVDHQHRTLDGRLDVLLVDSGGAIVVAELKVVEDDGMLVQALDYYDYVSANREALARVYAASKIDPTQPARLLLIASSFSVALINRTKWFNAPISLFAYRCVRVDGAASDDLLPVYIEMKPAPVVEPVATTNLESIVEYITDPQARLKATELLDLLRSFGPRISVDPVKGAISIKKDGRVFSYVWPRRRWFIFGYRGLDDQWINVDVEPQTDLADVRESLKASFARPVKGSA